jgi:hypothetical protein
MKNRSAKDRCTLLEDWIEHQRGLFNRIVKPKCGGDWPGMVWDLDPLRRQKEASDTPLKINFGLAIRFMQGIVVSLKGNKQPHTFIEFAKALVVEKAIRRSWDVSQASLDGLIEAVGFLMRATATVPASHPAELVGRHFDEVQRLIVDAVDRRDRFLEREGLPSNAKVNRIDDAGNIFLSARRGYGCTQTLVQIADILSKVCGGSKISFTKQLIWDNRGLDSRNLERERDREALFPDKEALYFLADLAQRASELEDVDRLMLRLFEVMLVADKRIGEVTCLGVGAVVERNGVVGLRYKPKKKGQPYVTWIPEERVADEEMKRNATESMPQWTAARQMFSRAIAEITEITQHSRELAAELEKAGSFEDVDLPDPENDWPLFMEDFEVEGLLPGTVLAENYTRADLRGMGLALGSAASRSAARDKPKEVQVIFRLRSGMKRVKPYMRPENYRDLSSAERDEAFGRFVTARAKLRPEQYLPFPRFCFLFADLPAHGREARERARIWWNKYHELLHGPGFDAAGYCQSATDLLMKPRSLMHKSELQKYIFEKYRKNRYVRRSPNPADTLLLSDALFCVDDRMMHPKANWYPFTRLLSAASVRNWLAGSVRHKSIFERFGRPDLATLAPHMLRRFNTTELRLAGVSSMYIARQAGRTVNRVDDYDYIPDETLIEIARTRLGSDVILEAQYVKDLADELQEKSVPLNSVVEFVGGLLKGRSKTEFGSCSHEHSIAPCPSFKACYMGCGEYWICKGDLAEVTQHRSDYKQTYAALEHAKAQLGSAFYSSHYVVQYGAQLITLRLILRIHADPSIPDGTMVKPMPEKRVPTEESLRALFEDEDAFKDTLDALDKLLAAGDGIDQSEAA